MLGERLFPLIQQTHPELAGKITGMLLEIDNAELLHMLEFREALAAKVEEAASILQVHQAGPRMSEQWVNPVPGAGPRSQKYRPPVNPAGAAQQPPANAANSSAGGAIPVSKTLLSIITEVIFNTWPTLSDYSTLPNAR